MPRSFRSRSMRVLTLALTVAFAPAVLVNCSKAADTHPAAAGPTLPDGSTPALLVQALDSATMVRMEQRTGVWREADASSEWRAMATQGNIRVIDETMRVGESSARRTTYYFSPDGKPVAYIEFRIQTVAASDRTPTQEYVLLKLEFSGDSISKREKTVNGAAMPLEGYEIENARTHAMTLYNAALSAPVTSPATP